MKRAVRIAGVSFVVAGLAAAVVGDRVPSLLTSRTLVLGTALLVLIVGLWFLADRRFSDPRRAAPPDRERGYRVPVPGEEIDRAVERGESMVTVRQRLVERVLVSLEEHGMSRDEAEAAVESGAWTDDPVAEAFLASTDRSIPVALRLRWFLRGESRRERTVARTVAALASLREGSRRE